MFGIKKKKPMKKNVKKVSKSAKKKVKKTTKKIVKDVQKKPVRRKGVKVGRKYFDSPDDATSYYKAEGEKVRKAMKQFRVNRAESYLGVAKGDLMKILSQKKKLNEIAQDLESHRDSLDKKIKELNSKKEKGKVHKRHVERFVKKMRALEAEAKKLLDTREELIHREAELISHMKEMARVAQRDLDLTDVSTAKELARFEISKDAVLAKAKDLLSEEANKLFADSSLLNRLDEKSVKRMSELNAQLARIHGAKKETLKKMHVLELSEKDTREKLAQSEAKVRKLEEKYQKLLKN